MPVQLKIDLLEIIVYKQNENWTNEFNFNVKYSNNFGEPIEVFRLKKEIGEFLGVGFFPDITAINQTIVLDILVENENNQFLFGLYSNVVEEDPGFDDRARNFLSFALPVQNAFTMEASQKIARESEGIDATFHYLISIEPTVK